MSSQKVKESLVVFLERECFTTFKLRKSPSMTFAYGYELFGSKLGNHHVTPWAVRCSKRQAARQKLLSSTRHSDSMIWLQETSSSGFTTLIRMDFNGLVWINILGLGSIMFVLFWSRYIPHGYLCVNHSIRHSRVIQIYDYAPWRLDPSHRCGPFR